jgi:dipeptidase E
MRFENVLNPDNRFVDELRACVPASCTALFICSEPHDRITTVKFALLFRDCLESAGFTFRAYDVLDGENQSDAEELVRHAELIILGGGHTPTQNRFFREIGLRELLKSYQGVLLGISAGSMNCAEVVYAQPEEVGEAVDPNYERFLPGLGLTDVMILPHYMPLQYHVLDNLRTIEDIAFPDSMGKKFYELVDGSYLLLRDGKQELRGEAYLIQDGGMTQISRLGETVML